MKRIGRPFAALAALAAVGALAAALAGSSGAVVKKDTCPGRSQAVALTASNDPSGFFAASFDLNGNTLICVTDG